MAELLIFMADKVGDDVYKDVGLEKRGDVIAVREDGWAWGTEELQNPLFRLVRVPSLSLSEAETLVQSEPSPDPDPLIVYRTLQKRAFKLDLDALLAAQPKEIADAFVDAKRKAEVVELPDAKGADDIRTVKTRKPPVADPNVIGDAG